MTAFGLKPQLVNIDKFKEIISGYVQKFDENHDGKIQFEEFFKLYQALKHDGFSSIEDSFNRENEEQKKQTNKKSKYLQRLLPSNRDYKLILACDGGGVRGMMTATFLVHLESVLGCQCFDIFDLMAGVSTGGFICAGFSALRLPGESVREIYVEDNMKTAMPVHGIIDKALGVVHTHSKYDGIGKTEILNKLFGDTKMGSSNPILVLHSYNLTKRKAEFFSSIKNPDLLVKEVLDISSAAPIYYPPAKLGDDYYIDGAMVENDPTMVALSEGMNIWGDDIPIRVLSIGTGVSSKPIDGKKAKEHEWGPLQWFSEGDLINVCLDSTISSMEAEDILGQNYFRVNGNLEDYNVDYNIDCLSYSNYNNLIDMGDKLWEKYGQQVIDFITAPSI